MQIPIFNNNILCQTLPIYFNPTLEGYKVYRTFHSNCYNGLLHTIFMPIATLAFFLFIHGLTGKKNYTMYIKNIILNLFFVGYLAMDPIIGIVTIAFYYLFLTRSLNYFIDNYPNARFKTYGTLVLTISVIIMEFIGHGYFEGHHSHLWELPNSIFHTPYLVLCR